MGLGNIPAAHPGGTSHPRRRLLSKSRSPVMARCNRCPTARTPSRAIGKLRGLRSIPAFTSFPPGLSLLSARTGQGVRAKDRPEDHRQQGGQRHGDHRRTRPAAHEGRARGSRTPAPIRSSRSPPTKRSSIWRNCTTAAKSRASCATTTGSAGSLRARSSANPARSSERRTAAITRSSRRSRRFSNGLQEPAFRSTPSERSRTSSRIAGSRSRTTPATTKRRANSSAGWTREKKNGLIIANFIDFDMLYGHRRDAKGYAHALEETDRWLSRVTSPSSPATTC